MENDPEWNMCCSYVHKSELTFFTQIIFLFTILIFSIIQIANNTDNKEMYFSLITGIMGIITPSPQFKRDQKI